MGAQSSVHQAPSVVRASPVEMLAYTCALDLDGHPDRALSLARDLLKDVRKSGLKSPYAEALLRRLALARWTKMDRPRPSRLENRDCKESAILLFFVTSWEATYEDLGAALLVSEDRARHLVHKARMEQVATITRIPIPKPECRRPRELLSDFHESWLSDPLADDVAQHLRECRECSTLDHHLQGVLAAPPKPLIEPPPELVGSRADRPSLSFALDAVSFAQRRAGVVLLVVGVLLGAVQFHPGLNASASDQLDRLGATLSRWRSQGAKLVEDLRVLKALAIGTVEGRTEELSQTLDEYVNSGDKPDSSPESPEPSPQSSPQPYNDKNKADPDAVLDSRDPENEPTGQTAQKPAEASLSPKSP